MSKANETQVAGTHYKDNSVIQHWDYAASHNFDYFQGQITKYVTRWKKKNGLQDLEKAQHFLQKYIELERAKQAPSTLGMGLGRIDKIPPIIRSEISLLQGHKVNPYMPFGYDPKEELGES